MDSVLSEHFDDILAHYNQYSRRPTEHQRKRLVAYISKQYRTTRKVAERVVSGTKRVYQKLRGPWKHKQRDSFGVPDPVLARIVGGGIVSEDNKIVNALDIIATVAALVPGVNFAAAPAAAITSILLGDVIGVILSLLELIPAIGIIPGAAKLIYRIRKIYKMSRRIRTGQIVPGRSAILRPGGSKPGFFARLPAKVQQVQQRTQQIQQQVQQKVQQVQQRVQQVQQQVRQVQQQVQRPSNFNGQLPQPGQSQEWFDWATLNYLKNDRNYDLSENTLCRGNIDSQLQYYLLQNRNLLTQLKKTGDTGKTFAKTILDRWNQLSVDARKAEKHCGIWDTTAPRVSS